MYLLHRVQTRLVFRLFPRHCIIWQTFRLFSTGDSEVVDAASTMGEKNSVVEHCRDEPFEILPLLLGGGEGAGVLSAEHRKNTIIQMP